MGKIIYLMGKSSTGKDTIYKRLLEREEFQFQTITPYTTRPVRVKEKEGVEYHFTDEEGFQELQRSGKLIEQRAYHTYHGLWRYFTVDDGQIDLEQNDYIYIGTLEAFESTVRYYGREKLVPVLIELDDGVRLQRALDRERKQAQPRYEELCRRFLADSQDFSEEKIQAAGIGAGRFYNDDLQSCLDKIAVYIKEELQK